MDLAEDDIDSEVLQAKIDLSMSVANDLVSSWIQPTASSSRKNAEQELKEYMRRPPRRSASRLGVGAAIPEGATFSLETSRLKSQLTGKNSKKRLREDDEINETVPSGSEEESRGSVVKKKAAVDPFGPKTKKRLKKNLQQEVAAPSSAPTRTSSSPKAETDKQTERPTNSPRKKRKKKRHEVSTISIDVPVSDSAVPSPNVQMTPSSSSNHKLDPPAVLNLNGPPSDSDNDVNEPALVKKKRKRRKKKNIQIPGMRSNAHVETSPKHTLNS